MPALVRITLGLLVTLLVGHAAAAEAVAVAAAANLAFVLKPLNAEFARVHPGVAVTDELGASGTLVAQITQGAPYDVFLSADLDYPQKLVRSGAADGSTLRVLGYGKLVLWTTRPGLELGAVAEVVRDPGVHKLAIADPRAAPYGRAAQEVLAKLGLTDVARPKLVYGDNISQAAHYVASGAVDAGFVALSLVLAPNLKERGRWLEIAPALYAPIAQGGVLTTRGAANPAARRYLAFLHSPAARPIWARFGYGLP
jgi:molybdate transport system substrate-binding protein